MTHETFNNRAQGRKKSKFPQKTTIPSNSTFDFVSEGTNFKIPESDLIAALGATGTIVQAGNVTDIPVLDKQGSVNNIRNLEPTGGVSIEVGPNNNIQISSALENGTSGGAEVLVDPSLVPVVARTLVGLGDISVAQIGDQIRIQGTSEPVTTNVVIVNSTDDMPDPVMVNGVMSIIPEEKEYHISQDITSIYPLTTPRASFRATFKATNRFKWTYTGTDACWRDDDGDGDIELFGLTQWEAPNGNMFDITAQAGFWSIQATFLPKFTNCKSLGMVSGGVSGNGTFNTFFGTYSDFHDGLILENLVFNEHSTMLVLPFNSAKLNYDGQSANFTIGETVTGGTSGATGVVEIDTDNGADGTLVISSVSGVFQNNEALTGSSTGVAVVDGVLQNTVAFTTQGTATTGTVTARNLTIINGTNNTVFDVKAEIEATVDNINYVGNMTEGGINGLGLAVGSLDPDTPKVESIANTFIKDTNPDALSSFIGNVTETVIATTSVPVKINATWVPVNSSLFTMDATGRSTYTGLKEISLPIDGSVTAKMASGGTNDVAFLVAINGSVITASAVPSQLNSSTAENTGLIWQHAFVTGDFVEFFVRNDSGTTNIVVSSAIKREN